MTDSTLYLLAILVAANIILIGVVIVRSLARRRRARHEAALTPSGTTRSVGGATGASVDRGPILAPTHDASLAPPRTDPLTGLLLPAEWNRIVGDEAARIHRYGRPATVVLFELDGLDKLIAVLGPEAGDRILPALTDVLSRHARAADHLARLGPGRFAVLLPETGEVEAVNYVERVREACELWLESGAIAMRLAIGWAAPPTDGGLADAVALAQDRMYFELRRNERRTADLVEERGTASHDFGGSPSPA